MRQSAGWAAVKFIILFILGFFLFMVIFSGFGFFDEVTVTSSEPITNNSVADENAYTHTETPNGALGFKLSLLCGLAFAVGVIWITDYNKCRRYEVDIPKQEANIQVALENSERLTSQANRVVEKYTAHEADVQKYVAQARGGAAPAQSVSNAADFRIAVEQYPALQANQSVLALLSQIEECENFIVRQKLLYNQTIADFNYTIRVFPFVILRKALKLEPLANKFDFTPLNRPEITDAMLGI